jgi:hypothetical protein
MQINKHCDLQDLRLRLEIFSQKNSSPWLALDIATAMPTLKTLVFCRFFTVLALCDHQGGNRLQWEGTNSCRFYGKGKGFLIFQQPISRGTPFQSSTNFFGLSVTVPEKTAESRSLRGRFRNRRKQVCRGYFKTRRNAPREPGFQVNRKR